EHDRRGRTHRLAGGHYFSIPDPAPLLFGRDTGTRHALNAVTAFLHHAAHAHRDLGIARGLQAFFVARIREEVEAAHLVGAVVRAETRAHAPVVDLDVQAFAVVNRRADGTHGLARRVLAVHARHGLEEHARCLHRSLVVSIDANPVHLAPARDLFLADRRYVV